MEVPFNKWQDMLKDAFGDIHSGIGGLSPLAQGLQLFILVCREVVLTSVRILAMGTQLLELHEELGFLTCHCGRCHLLYMHIDFWLPQEQIVGGQKTAGPSSHGSFTYDSIQQC